jgi:hypothetical protein
MAKCEDYPCCGHEVGDCPDSSGRMKCVKCGKRLSKNAASSICATCIRKMNRRMSSGGDDHDYSMNY